MQSDFYESHLLDSQSAGVDLYHRFTVVKDLHTDCISSHELMSAHEFSNQYVPAGNNVFQIGTDSCTECDLNKKN